MSCGRWEELIALEETGTPELRAHLAACLECQRLAEEIAATRQVLGGLRDPAIDSVRPLVLARIDGMERRRVWWPAWAAAAAVVVAIAFYIRPALQVETMPLPVMQIAKLAPRVAVPPATTVRKVRKPRTPALNRGVQEVKIQTGDPNVLLIWVMD